MTWWPDDKMTGFSSRVTRSMASFFNIKTILFFFLVLGSIYGIVTPLFEKPDENWHFAYVKSLADGHGFPAAPLVVADDQPSQESSQPPLYYAAAALVVHLFVTDIGDFSSYLQRNPATSVSLADNDNKNMFIHTAAARSLLTGTHLAVWLARFVALLFGAMTVLATYGLCLEAFPHRPNVARVAASIVAFVPQFVFISSAVSNDSAAAATSGLALWATVRVMRHGWSVRRMVGLGGALGLAGLSKASAIGLLPLALLMIVAASLFSSNVAGDPVRVNWRRQILWLGAVGGLAIAMAGPWYIRSYLVFGDVLGLTTHLAMPWARATPVELDEALHALPLTVVSFWLAFGWGTVSAPSGLYIVLNVIAFICLLGALRILLVSPDPIERSSVVLLGLWLLVIVAALIRWNQLLGAPLGRLAFPSIPAVGTLMGVGWISLTQSTFLQRGRSFLQKPWITAILPLGFLILSAAAIPAYLMRAYAPPPGLSQEQVAHQPGHPVDIRYGDVARLIWIDLPRSDWPHPGKPITVRLCWETLRQDPHDPLVFVQLVTSDSRVVASRRTLPGLGAFSTSTWQPGLRFCDDVSVRIKASAQAPAVDWVEVGFIDTATRKRLVAYGPDGSVLDTYFVGQTKVAPLSYEIAPIENELSYFLGDDIELIGYALDPGAIRPNAAVHLRLYWRTLHRPDADYTAFVHVSDTGGRILAQADGQPQSGAYPTSFWDEGEVVIDDHLILIPADAAPGEYSVTVGLYRLATGERLALTKGGSGTEIVLPSKIQVH